MLEGLEITIKSLKEFGINNPTLRLDSEFFKKEYLELYKTLFEKPCDKLEILTNWVTQGPNPIFQEYEGIPCLTGRNINDGRVSYKGSIGKIGYVTDGRKAIFSRNIGIIRPNKINAGYVNAFILSKYGAKIIARGETGGTGQSTLTTAYLKNIDIPRIGIEKEIGSIVELSEKVLTESQKAYKVAETFLVETLGLKDMEPNTEPINIKDFKDSFLATGRLDAEYYQKKYEDYIGLIQSYPNGYEELSISCNQRDSNFTPEDNIEYKYIELADIGKSGEIKGCTIALGIELPSRARRKVNTNDVIISSIEGSLGCCALVTEEYNNALCSTGFYIINSKKIISETLLVLFKSELMQNVLKQNCSGTILTAINKNEFRKIPVPLIDKSIQESLKEKLEESFRLKKQSEQLLETAKRAVEIAIEQDEEAAMRYIEEQS